MKKIGIIGPNKSMCSKEIYDFGVELGKRLSSHEIVIICGGLGGFMEAVCCGVKQSNKTFSGQTIGILPDSKTDNANAYIDIPIATGIGIARNIIIVNSADIIIAVGGGAGTLSEIAIAWQQKKTVLCVTLFDGWAKEMAGRNLDNRENSLLIPVDSIEEILKQLNHG